MPRPRLTFCSTFVRLLGPAIFCFALTPLLVAQDAPSYRAEVLAVHDGDTMTVRIAMGWGVSLEATVRAADYDAFELTRTRRTVGTITDDEIAAGKKARDALKDYLSGKQLWISPSDREGRGVRDAYGRVLAVLRVRDGDRDVYLKDWMATNKFLRAKTNGD